MSKVVCKPLLEWLREPSDKCKECALGLLVAWYKDELGIDEVKDLVDLSPEEVVEQLDRLKKKHPEKAERLKQLDCLIQQAVEEIL